MAQSGVAFGTSGARGEVVAMTDRICFAYTAGFLQHLRASGEFAAGTRVALAGDLRPSTPRILAACAEAAQGDVVSAVNFNAPGQVVIAGSATAVERAIEAITEAARTGKIGDGKIFIVDIEQVVRIRTGDSGPQAL